MGSDREGSAVIGVLRERDAEILPGQHVGRVLPAPPLMHVGPFVFLDHGGPHDYAVGQGSDVGPHPHIGLATVTYLLDGEILHRDSLGSAQRVLPGAINWMTAARGIAHSERTPPELRAQTHRLHLLQFWVGLPKARELDDPRFASYPPETLPTAVTLAPGATARVLVGSGWGTTSPVATASPTFLAEVTFAAAGAIRLPRIPEMAALTLEGAVSCSGTLAPRGAALHFASSAEPLVETTGPARLVVFGGEPLDGPRYIWWNFVSSSQERIVEAARAWRERRWPLIPGDDVEFVPLAREPHFPHS